MITAIDERPVVQEAVVQEPVVNEDIWRAWAKKGRLREQAGARKIKLAAGIGVVLLVLGSAYYWVR
jgi:hypothetical protein